MGSTIKNLFKLLTILIDESSSIKKLKSYTSKDKTEWNIDNVIFSKEVLYEEYE